MSYGRGIGVIMKKPVLSPNFTIEDIHKVVRRLDETGYAV